jgi:hypothetical protein
MLRGAALDVTAFGDLLDDLGGEGAEVAGLTRGDDALIDNDRGILPFGAGVDHAGLAQPQQLRQQDDFTPRAFSAG